MSRYTKHTGKTFDEYWNLADVSYRDAQITRRNCDDYGGAAGLCGLDRHGPYKYHYERYEAYYNLVRALCAAYPDDLELRALAYAMYTIDTAHGGNLAAFRDAMRAGRGPLACCEEEFRDYYEDFCRAVYTLAEFPRYVFDRQIGAEQDMYEEFLKTV